MQKLKISVSPAMLILMICMTATTPLPQLCASLCAAAIHELGHIAAANLFAINLSHMKLDILGARLKTSGRLCSYPALIALCFAGPFVNFLCFALAFPFCEHADWLKEFCMASLSLGFINLIPIQGFDGGRIVHGFLSMLFSVGTVERVCGFLSFCSLLCMWLLSVWMMLRTGSSLTLFVFSCCVFGMLFA